MATEAQFAILLWEIGIALVLQVGVFTGIALVFHKRTKRIRFIANEIYQRTIPILESTNAFLETAKPQLETILANLTESSEKIKSQVDDIADRTRQQVERADELVTRTITKVEETTDFVEHAVITPVRQLAGVLTGLSMGINVLFGRRGPGRTPRSGNGSGASRDEMFI